MDGPERIKGSDPSAAMDGRHPWRDDVRSGGAEPALPVGGASFRGGPWMGRSESRGQTQVRPWMAATRGGMMFAPAEPSRLCRSAERVFAEAHGWAGANQGVRPKCGHGWPPPVAG